MRAITKYVANDGSEWNSPEKAVERDAMIERCRLAMEPLGDTPDGLKDWSYMQHDRIAYVSAKSGIIAILREMPALDFLANLSDEEISTHAGGGVAYTVSSDDTPVAKAWNRLGRISMTTFREYNQPYFAINEARAPLEDPSRS